MKMHRVYGQSNTRTKKGVISKIVLGLLLAGGGIVVLAMAPGLATALKLIDPNPRKAMGKLERALRNLASAGDIKTSGKKGQKQYRITTTGRQKLARLKFAEYAVPEQVKWDGKWRVVCFDIPETKKYNRTLFQTKLSALGFYRLQNSVFVYPYPCDQLIKLAYGAFGLQKFVRIIVADHIDNEAHILNFFKLKR